MTPEELDAIEAAVRKLVPSSSAVSLPVYTFYCLCAALRAAWKENERLRQAVETLIAKRETHET